MDKVLNFLIKSDLFGPTYFQPRRNKITIYLFTIIGSVKKK